MSELTLAISRANKDDTAWSHSGQTTPKLMAVMLHGKTIRKFEVRTDSYQNITCVMTFSGGDKLHIYAAQTYLVDYHRIGKA